MILQQLLPELGDKMNLGPLDLPEGGQLTLTFDDVWNITIEHDAMEDEIVLFLPLQSLTAGQLEDQAVLELLQNRCLLGAKSGGFALSIRKEEGDAILWRRFPNDFFSADDILAKLTRLLDAAKELLEQAGMAASATLETAAGESSAFQTSGYELEALFNQNLCL